MYIELRYGNPLQSSCLGNPMDRGTWWATVCGVSKESDMTEQLINKWNKEREGKWELHR